jgi:hypothetical protein
MRHWPLTATCLLTYLPATETDQPSVARPDQGRRITRRTAFPEPSGPTPDGEKLLLNAVTPRNPREEQGTVARPARSAVVADDRTVPGVVTT